MPSNPADLQALLDEFANTIQQVNDGLKLDTSSSSSGPTTGQIKRDIADFGEALRVLRTGTIPVLADTMDQLIPLFSALRDGSEHLARGGFGELDRALKKLQQVNVTRDASKLGDVINLMTTAVEKAGRGVHASATKAANQEEKENAAEIARNAKAHAKEMAEERRREAKEAREIEQAAKAHAREIEKAAKEQERAATKVARELERAAEKVAREEERRQKEQQKAIERAGKEEERKQREAVRAEEIRLREIEGNRSPLERSARAAGRSLGSTVGLGGAGASIGLTLGGFGERLTEPLNAMKAAVGGVTGAFGALLGPIGSLAGSVGSFVEALNPGLMRLFNQAIRDLMATLGVAFAPVIRGLSALANELSATLAPAMRALEPIIDTLMSVLEGTLVPIIGIVADAFVVMSPLIQFVATIMAQVSEAMRIFYTVLRSALSVLWDVVKNLFGGVDLKGAAAGLQDAIRQMTRYFVQFAAYVAKALGYLDPFAKALEENLNAIKGQRPGVKAAPENVRIAGLEQISKDLAVAAFAAQVATGGKRKMSEAEFLEKLLEEVKEVQKNSKTLKDFFNELSERFGNTLITGLVKGFEGDLSELWRKFLDWWNSKSATPEPVREGVDPIHMNPLRGAMM